MMRPSVYSGRHLVTHWIDGSFVFGHVLECVYIYEGVKNATLERPGCCNLIIALEEELCACGSVVSRWTLCAKVQ